MTSSSNVLMLSSSGLKALLICLIPLSAHNLKPPSALPGTK
uniref:Uncharacterized protein n=1 Tax=Anguilla anguilla TaxID=7936 RepID=A0A0E9T9I4_ANGAN